MLYTLDRLAPHQHPYSGAKAGHLATLRQAGFRVPAGYVVPTTAFAAAVDETPALATALDRFTLENAEEGSGERDALAETIRAIVLTMPLPAALATVLDEAFAALRAEGHEAVAVRSSATLEDLAGSSFAGLYESVLDVTSTAELHHALRRCWASAFAPRVLEYCRHRGLAVAQIQPAALIQGMVPAEVAGVLFTADPVNGNDRTLVIEAVPGLGESLVQGEVDPQGYRYDWYHDELHHDPAATLLTPAEVRVLGEAALAIQEHFGAPQDIEWARLKGEFFILQARPIAAIRYAVEEEWTNADLKDGGVASTITTPLMWSLYEGVLEETMPGYLAATGMLSKPLPRRWTACFFGYPYWNLSAIKAGVKRIPGFVERKFDQDLGIEPAYEGDGETTGLNLISLFHGLRVLFLIHRSIRRRLDSAAETTTRLATLLEALDTVRLAALDDAALADHVETLVTDHYRDVEGTYFNTIYDNSNAATLFHQALETYNRKTAHPLSYLHLVSGLEDVAHLRSVHELWELSRRLRARPETMAALAGLDADALAALHSSGAEYPGRPEIAAYLVRHQHRSARELDLTVPRWDEDPRQPLHSLLTALGQGDEHDPREVQRGSRESYRREAARIHAAGLRRRLATHRALLALREERRDLSTRMYRLLRRAFLELGRRLTARGLLDEPGAIVFLTHGEALRLFRGEAQEALLRRLERNHRLYRSFRNYARPDEIRPEGRAVAATAGSGSAAPGVLRGIACSPGVVEGVVRVLNGIEEGHLLQPGEILVAPYTDPAWTPLFATISGLITETGGMLSHGAVVAREYGVPAVLAVKGARTRLKSGCRVRLDGRAGEIIPLDGSVLP